MNRAIDFISTRNEKEKILFWESVIQGAAADGGLLIPEKFPVIQKETIRDKKFWEKVKIHELSSMLHHLFIPETEVSWSELSEMMKKAHNFALPLEKVSGNDFVLRIDRGPTASFKDIAARSLAQLMERYCEKFDKKLNIVVATSGDTGVAIADAFGGSKRITVTVLYPSDGVSPIQEKQMIEIHHKYAGEQSIPIKGNFDNCQDISKILQASRGLDSLDEKEKKTRVNEIIEEVKVKLGREVDVTYVEKMAGIVEHINLSSANSINVWRLIPQMTQYFVAYGQLVKSGEIEAGQKIVFSVPTGNVGHLMAGIYAREAGLPIKNFIMATNANNILANVIGGGAIKHKGFSKTSSPSMDILDPSNLERLLSYAAYKVDFNGKIDYKKMKVDIKEMDDLITQSKKEISELKRIHASKEEIDRAYHDFRKSWKAPNSISDYGVSESMLDYLKGLIWAEDVETDEEIYSMINFVNKKFNKVLDPHGVSAYIALLRARAKNIIDEEDKVIFFETAHPDKFGDALTEAGVKVPRRERHRTLSRLIRMNLKKMIKPQEVGADPLLVAEKVANLARRGN